MVEIFSLEELKLLDVLQPTLLISDRTSFLYPREFLEKKNYLAVNVHPSLLPFHKGAHPIFWSCLLNAKWGISLHEIDPGIDSGNLVLQQEVEYSDAMTFQDVYDIYRECTFEMLKSLVEMMLEGHTPTTKPQPDIALGSHRIRNVQPLISQLRNGWNTTIRDARVDLETFLIRAHYPIPTNF